MGAVIALLGHPPWRTLLLMVEGSIGSADALAESAVRSVPLLFTALAVCIAFRAGVWNIGGEGQFIVGSIAALWVAQQVPPGVAAVAAFAAASLAGAAWASLATLLRHARGAPEVLTTILLNFVALHLLGWMVNGPMQEIGRRYPQSDPIHPSAALDRFDPTRLHTGVWIALAIAVLLQLLLFHTRTGLRIRATGAAPLAARWAGVRIDRQSALAMAVSGGIAGLGGAVEVLGVTGRLFERFASGVGYSGITVALLAQLHPIGSIASAFFFGGLARGAAELQRGADISSGIAVLGQGVAVLTLLALSSGVRLPARFRRRAVEEPAP